jgi:hypothetical protein
MRSAVSKDEERGMSDVEHLTVEEDGRVLADATVSPPDGNNRTRAQVHVAAGHLPPGTRRKLVDALQAAVAESDATSLVASVPLGDTELVEGLREHLTDVTLRAAGATSIIEGGVEAT